jgi:hypothetical protein
MSTVDLDIGRADRQLRIASGKELVALAWRSLISSLS